MIKILSKDKTIKEYYTICTRCGVEIKGSSDKHVKTSLKAHLFFKHDLKKYEDNEL